MHVRSVVALRRFTSRISAGPSERKFCSYRRLGLCPHNVHDKIFGGKVCGVAAAILSSCLVTRAECRNIIHTECDRRRCACRGNQLPSLFVAWTGCLRGFSLCHGNDIRDELRSKIRLPTYAPHLYVRIPITEVSLSLTFGILFLSTYEPIPFNQSLNQSPLVAVSVTAKKRRTEGYSRAGRHSRSELLMVNHLHRKNTR